MDLATIEWIIMAGILAVVICVGVWNSRRGHVTGATQGASLLELSISTCVTFSSSVAMMGVPGETFKIGPRYGLIILSYPIFTFILCKWFVDKYRTADIKSVFDFIELKFDQKTKKIALLIYILQEGFKRCKITSHWDQQFTDRLVCRHTWSWIGTWWPGFLLPDLVQKDECCLG